MKCRVTPLLVALASNARPEARRRMPLKNGIPREVLHTGAPNGRSRTATWPFGPFVLPSCPGRPSQSNQTGLANDTFGEMDWAGGTDADLDQNPDVHEHEQPCSSRSAALDCCLQNRFLHRVTAYWTHAPSSLRSKMEDRMHIPGNGYQLLTKYKVATGGSPSLRTRCRLVLFSVIVSTTCCYYILLLPHGKVNQACRLIYHIGLALHNLSIASD